MLAKRQRRNIWWMLLLELFKLAVEWSPHTRRPNGRCVRTSDNFKSSTFIFGHLALYTERSDEYILPTLEDPVNVDYTVFSHSATWDFFDLQVLTYVRNGFTPLPRTANGHY